MTQDKDQKRLVRERMKKTGESYTSARSALLGKIKYAAPQRDWPALAGQRDELLMERTGRTWANWVKSLNGHRAAQLAHPDIVKQVRAIDSDVTHWWAQTIAVGYERIVGLRDVGQKRDGNFEANKSRTFPVGVSALFQAFKDNKRRRRWLPQGVARLRTASENKSIRFDWEGETQVNLYFTKKGPEKSAVAIQHTKLASRGDIKRAKDEWSARLDALGEHLYLQHGQEGSDYR